MILSTSRRLWRRLGFFVSEHEKVLLALLSVVIVISGAFWFRQYADRHDQGPNIGGSYVEGVVGDQSVVDALVSRMTRVGLFEFNDTGDLTPVIVESWSKNEASTEYQFVIKNKITAQSVADQLLKNIAIFGSAVVSAEGQTLKIVTPTPNPNIPILLTQPLIDGGPYKFSKSTGATTILSKNPRTLGPSPFINKVVIHRFETEEELLRAINRRRVDGALSVRERLDNPRFTSVEITPPRYFGVVLNINRSPFRDEGFRRAVLHNQQIPPRDIVLTVPDQQPQKRLAEELVNDWQARGARVRLEIKNLDEFTDQILPTRNFEAVVMGIDYGLELDPHYLWNSDQIRPPLNNVSGVRDPRVDQIIASIRAANNIVVRNQLIDDLHNKLAELGVSLILEQQTFQTLVSRQVSYVEAPLPLSINDKFRKISRWYFK